MVRKYGYVEHPDDLWMSAAGAGGYSHLLRDSENHLAGHAVFHPEDRTPDDGPSHDEHEAPDADASDAGAELLALAVIAAAGAMAAGSYVGVKKAVPHVQRLMSRKTLPRMRALWSKARRKRGDERETALAEETVAGRSQDLAETAAGPGLQMSIAEAQARYRASLAARAYSDEQMRLVSNALIVDDECLVDLKRFLADLPSDEAKKLVETMASDPHLLSEGTLSELASLLTQRYSSIADQQLRLD